MESKIEDINRVIESRDYSFDIPLGENVFLYFERRNGNIPQNTLNLKEENSTVTIPLKFSSEDFSKTLYELHGPEKKSLDSLEGVVKDRIIFLATLGMNLQEDRVELFKNRLIKAKEEMFKCSEEFLESKQHYINRLRFWGEGCAIGMRNANDIYDKAFKGKVSQGYNREIDGYAAFYLGWSFLKDVSMNFSQRLGADASFLEKTIDEEAGQRLKEVAHFYQQISGHSATVEKALQLLVSRALFLYGIKSDKIKQPKLGLLKEKIKDKIINL